MAAMLRSFTNFIYHSRIRAVGVAFLLSFIPLLGPTLSIILVGLITLSQDALEGFLILIAATIPSLLQLFFLPMPDGLWIVAMVALSNFLTWAFAVLLRRTGSWSMVLEFAALIGIMAVIGTHVIKPNIETWWENQIKTYAAQGLANLDEKTKSNQVVTEKPLEPEVIFFVNAVKPYVTGIVAASLLFNVLLQLFVSRWWQMLIQGTQRIRIELQQVRLNSIAGVVFLTALILSYFKIALAQDLLPVLYLTFCLAGLSLVHYVAGKLKGLTWLCLTVFYMVLIGTWMAYRMPLVFQLVALAALLDIWFDWRERLDKRLTH